MYPQQSVLNSLNIFFISTSCYSYSISYVVSDFNFLFSLFACHHCPNSISFILCCFQFLFTASAAKEAMLPYFPQIVEFIKVIIT